MFITDWNIFSCVVFQTKLLLKRIQLFFFFFLLSVPEWWLVCSRICEKSCQKWHIHHLISWWPANDVFSRHTWKKWYLTCLCWGKKKSCCKWKISACSSRHIGQHWTQFWWMKKEISYNRQSGLCMTDFVYPYLVSVNKKGGRGETSMLC